MIEKYYLTQNRMKRENGWKSTETNHNNLLTPFHNFPEQNWRPRGSQAMVASCVEYGVLNTEYLIISSNKTKEQGSY